MLRTITWKISILAIVCGGIAGAIASLIFTPRIQEEAQRDKKLPPFAAVSPTSTEAPVALIPVERPTPPLLPPPLLTRRSSAIATLYRKSNKGASFDERLLGPERTLGRAVALTSDGWFVTSANLFETMRLADIVIWHNKKSYTPERGVIDRLNHTIFFKTNARDLSVSAFIQPGQIAIGALVWGEVRPEGFAPHTILDTRARVTPNEYASSEVASRRFILNGRSASTDRGGAVWNSNGSLVGIIESKEGEEFRVIPATSIANSFASLLDRNEIRHAELGVRALDLAVARFSGPRGALPDQGALVRVPLETPAAKASLKTGDVILRVGHDILDGTADLGEILSEYRPGSVVTLRVLRHTSDEKAPPTDIDVPVTLGSVRTSEQLK